MKLFKLISHLALLTYFLPTTAGAATCTNEGEIKWKPDGTTLAVMFCDGSNWVSMDRGSTGVACAASPGVYQYDSTANIFKFCGAADGFWHSMKGSIGDPCSKAGVLAYNGLVVAFCDGSNWQMTTTPTICTANLISGTSYTVPTYWGTPNRIMAIGGGGGGAGGQTGPNRNGGGGAGGNFSINKNISLTGGAIVSYSLGAAGSGGATATNGGAGGDTYFCNSTLNCGSISGTAVVVGAKGGPGGTLPATTQTVSVSQNYPSGAGFVGGVGYSNTSTNTVQYCGGGAAGPNGPGKNGGYGLGGAGDAGAGGAGGVGFPGGNGYLNLAYSGDEWGTGLGAGGGGGGGRGVGYPGTAGGNYGGGGSGANHNNVQSGGDGGSGIIHLIWTSALAANCN